MANISDLMQGTRIRIATEQKPGEVAKFDVMSTFHHAQDEAYFFVSVPLVEGKPLEVDDSQKLLLMYEVGGEQMLMAAYRDDTVQIGLRRYWKLRLTTMPHHFVARSEVRIKASLRCLYRADNEPDEEMTDAMTLDISTRGAALYLDRRFRVGDYLQLALPKAGASAEGEAPQIVIGAVCWTREAPKGSYYRNLCGLQYRFADDLQLEQMQKYCAYVKRRYVL